MPGYDAAGEPKIQVDVVVHLDSRAFLARICAAKDASATSACSSTYRGSLSAQQAGSSMRVTHQRSCSVVRLRLGVR